MMQVTSANDIENWLNELQTLQSTRLCEGPRFIKPFHLATLAHTLRREGAMHLKLPEKIAPYADAMNLWGAIGVPSPFGDRQKHPGGRHFPIQMLTDPSTIEDVAADLSRLFAEACSNAQTIDAVQTMLRELIGNCYAHSDVSDGVHGAICAQVWAGGRKAQIAIADSGIGIRGSLQQNEQLFDKLNSSNSCEFATQYGVTSKPGKGHSGYGLAIARKLLEQNNGVLYVRSGDEAFHLSFNQSKNTSTATDWNGTLLVIEWHLDQPMDISQVYAEFPLPEGMSDDDFDF